MLTIVEDPDFQLVKTAIETQMTEALMNKSDDVETFERLANLNKRLNQARGLYINQRYNYNDTSNRNGN